MNINSANTQNINQIQNLDTVATGNDANDANKVGVLEKGINTNEHEVSISRRVKLVLILLIYQKNSNKRLKGIYNL